MVPFYLPLNTYLFVSVTPWAGLDSLCSCKAPATFSVLCIYEKHKYFFNIGLLLECKLSESKDVPFSLHPLSLALVGAYIFVEWLRNPHFN